MAQIGQWQTPPISAPAVHKALTKHLHETVHEPTEAVRQLEMARLDTYLAGIAEKASNGDIWAINAALAIHDRRARLTGINAPEKVEEVGAVADAKRTLLEKLNKMAARTAVAVAAVEPLAIEHEAADPQIH